MGRFFLILGFIAVALLALRYWQQKGQQHVRNLRKNDDRKNKMKSKGQLVRDPKTGEYRVEADDEDH